MCRRIDSGGNWGCGKEEQRAAYSCGRRQVPDRRLGADSLRSGAPCLDRISPKGARVRRAGARSSAAGPRPSSRSCAISSACVLERPAPERRLTDLGELAWLAVFDEDDQRTFRRELLEALVRAVALDSVEPVDACLDEWRRTARALSNEKSRRILTSSGEELGESI